MIAGRLVAPRRLELIEIPEPELREPEHILFEVETAALCGSDLPYYLGRVGPHPLDPGYSLHEMVGRVKASTSGRFREGDRVLAVPFDQCGLMERFVVPAGRAVPLPEGPPAERLVLAQPLGTVLYALRKLPNLLGTRAAVLGLGPIGQIFVRVLTRLGARAVAGVDPVPERRKAALEGGARAACAPEEPELASRIEEALEGPPDLVVEAIGHDRIALDLAVAIAPRGASVLSFGVPPEGTVGLPWRALFFKNLTVYTSVNPDFTVDFPLAVRWAAEGRLDLEGLVTHRFPLAEIARAFELFASRRDGVLKVLVDFAS